MKFLTEAIQQDFGADVYATTAVENNFFLMGAFEDLKDGTIRLFQKWFN